MKLFTKNANNKLLYMIIFLSIILSDRVLAVSNVTPNAYDIKPTLFHIHNGLGTIIHNFKIKEGDKWLELGEINPGDREFTLDSDNNIYYGTFEYQSDSQLVSGDYSLGGYNKPENGQVFIPINKDTNGDINFKLLVPQSNPVNGVVTYQDTKVNLMLVPQAKSFWSRFMLCGAAGYGMQALICTGNKFIFAGGGIGVYIGANFGYLFSFNSDEDLMDYDNYLYIYEFASGGVFPEVFLINLNGFSVVDDGRKRRNAVFVGGGIASLPAGGGAGVGNFLPWWWTDVDGSYKQSCSNIALNKTSLLLSATCDKELGGTSDSVLSYASCSGGIVRNNNGTLECDLPAGSYKNSCNSSTYNGKSLVAKCKLSDNQTEHLSILNIADTCEAGSSISNNNGTLVCDIPKKAPSPTGPYTASCSGIDYAQGILTAKSCGSGFDGKSFDLTLYYDRDCQANSEVGFTGAGNQGSLYCLKPR